MNSKTLKHFGRYVIHKEVDRGAMGVLYHAEDSANGRMVILKALSAASCFQDVRFRERFYREAEAAGRLAHPGIVPLLEIAENPETRTPYFVIEPVAGDTLDDVLTGTGGKFPAHDALRLASEVATALEYAHEHGVVHGDLTPENIVVSEDGHAKITGFGVARVNVFKVTTQGQMFCTPAYMAPELLKGSEVDGRCDLFSLGAILYTLLTGSRPFQSSSKPADKGPIPASVLNDGVCTEVDGIIARALERDPEKRYQHASEMMLDFQDVQEGRVPRSLQNPPAVVQAAVTETTPAHVSMPEPAPVVPAQTSVHESRSEASSHEPKPAAVPEPTQAPAHSEMPAAAASSSRSESKAEISTQQAHPSVPKPKQTPARSATPAPVKTAVSRVASQKPALLHPALIEQASKIMRDTRVLIGLAVVLVVASCALVMHQRRVSELAALELSRSAASNAENADNAAASTPDNSGAVGATSKSKNKTSKSVAKLKRPARRHSAPLEVATNAAPAEAAPQLILADAPATPGLVAPVLMSSLDVTVHHHFKGAVLSLSVDGNPASQFALEGSESRRMLVLKRVQGQDQHAMKVPIGSHHISVKVHCYNTSCDQSAETVHTFQQGAESKLMVSFDKHDKMALSFQ